MSEMNCLISVDKTKLLILIDVFSDDRKKKKLCKTWM